MITWGETRGSVMTTLVLGDEHRMFLDAMADVLGQLWLHRRRVRHDRVDAGGGTAAEAGRLPPRPLHSLLSVLSQRERDVLLRMMEGSAGGR
jgi:hypothetical protein